MSVTMRKTFNPASGFTNIWRYKPIAGYWELVRDSHRDNIDAWLRIFRQDDPNVIFCARWKRPTATPATEQEGER